MTQKYLAFCMFILFSTATWAQQSDNNAPWKSLFNGKNLNGWQMKGSNGVAMVQDGAIVCHQLVNTPQHTFVCTKKKYENYILEADAMIEGSLHTGFILRAVDAIGDTAHVSLYGYQVKIDPSNRKWTGGVFDDFGNKWNWLYTLENSEKSRSAFKMFEWNHFRIEAIGNNIKVWVNDIPTCNLVNSKYTKGYIAMKIHSMIATPEMEKVLMRYKNIRIITRNPEKYQKAMDLPLKEN